MRKDTILDRFLAKVDIAPNGCWLWTGSKAKGYGKFRDGPYKLAHRWSYEHHKGPIPKGLYIDHLCRTRLCVNPDHLEVVTPRENALRVLPRAKITPSMMWRILYRDLYKQIYGDHVTEEEWIDDAEKRRNSLLNRNIY